MHILLTNDDGIYAEGIYALYQELIKIAKVTVVAPDSERSSVGHGITLSHPIWVKKTKRKNRFFGYGISGTPADCVKFAVRVILKKKPDMVISGINCGDNDGCSVFYSGTVAGAREGAIMGIPSMAISLATFHNPNFRYAAKLGRQLTKRFSKEAIRSGTFLNINVPAVPESKIKGMRVTRQNTTPIHCEFRKRVDPHLRNYYWMTGKIPAARKSLSNDSSALQQHYVTITPITCDMTAEAVLEQLQHWNK